MRLSPNTSTALIRPVIGLQVQTSLIALIMNKACRASTRNAGDLLNSESARLCKRTSCASNMTFADWTTEILMSPQGYSEVVSHKKYLPAPLGLHICCCRAARGRLTFIREHQGTENLGWMCSALHHSTVAPLVCDLD